MERGYYVVSNVPIRCIAWVLGKCYSAAPTSDTCHMGATSKLAATHHVGARDSWNLRPEFAMQP